MGTAMVPRKEMRTEFFLTDRWVTIHDIRHASGLGITYGSSSQDRAVPPAKLNAVLENESERYSRRNPLSTNYGKIKSNTPVRVTLGLTGDLYGRTSVSAWGISTYNDLWADTGSAGTVVTDFNVAAGAATHRVAAGNTFRISYMPGQLHRDVDVAVSCSVGTSNVTGGDMEPCNILIRGASTTDYLMIRVVITTAEAFTIKIMRADGTSYSSAVTVPGLTHSGQLFRVRAQAELGIVRAKLWVVDTSIADSNGEPDTWHVEASVPADLLRVGWVGVRSGLAATNTNAPATISYRELEVRSDRFIGEASAMVPRWNLAETDRTVALDASGLLQRLQKGQAPLKSTLRRSIPTLPDLVAYWPMEDGSEAQSFASGIPGAAPMTIDPAGEQTLATYGDIPSSGALPTVGFAVWRGAVPTYTSIDEIQARFLMRMSEFAVTSGFPIMRLWTGGGSLAFWDIRGGPFAGNLTLVANDGASDVLSFDMGFDLREQSVRLSLELKQNGANVDWGLWSLEVGAGSGFGFTGTLNSQTIGVAQRFDFSLGFHLDDMVLGHASVEKKVTSIFDLHSQLNAFDGETATARMTRLCTEESIPLAISGTVDSDARMGAQRPDTLINLLKDCAKLDMGILGESRGRLGLLYRTRLSMLNQTAVAVIDRAKGQLSAPFDPTDDDRLTMNDVTAERAHGSTARAEQITGPFSTAEPPTGVGRYDTSETFNAYRDTQLPDLAGWLLSLGTVDEYRVPGVTADGSVWEVQQDTALASGLLSLAPGDLITVTGLAPLGIYDDVNQVAHGYTETLYPHSHIIAANTFPASPYAALKLDDAVLGRAASGSSTTNASFTAVAASFAVATSDVQDLWVTGSGSDFPLDVMVAGERIRISSISGASSPQTFTVAAAGRALNGVVKAHVAGEPVRVATPVRLA